MAKHTRIQTDEQRKRLEENRQTLIEAISGTGTHAHPYTQTAGLSLALERIAVNRDTGMAVLYDGYAGLERVFGELAKTYRGGEVYADGHLVGVRGTLSIEGQEQTIDLSATVGVGSQIILEVGPAVLIEALLDAIRVFDRQFHLACVTLGHDYELVAQGYNPYATSPSDIVAVPLSRYVLMNAYLSRTGRYARDAMRCTAATRVLLPVSADEQQAVEDYQICAALAPLLAFLTDNTLMMRGAEPTKAQYMIRSSVWDQVDPARCRIVPGTFGDQFGFEAYEHWLEGIKPIFFTSDEGVTFSTGSDTCGRVMEERDLTTTEALRFASMAFPQARWCGCLELLCADALPTRLAGGYAAFFKGLFASAESRAAARELLKLSDIDEDAVASAWRDLRTQGWTARPYGSPIGKLADELANIASAQLELRTEKRLLDSLAQLWMVRMVPRDSLLHNWEKNHSQPKEKELIELYGEGAVVPYEELIGEPPSGATTVMQVIRQNGERKL